MKDKKITKEIITLEKILRYLKKKYKINYVKELLFDNRINVKMRKFRFDYCFTSIKLAIEYEGISSGFSGHTTNKGYRSNCEKYNLAAELGYTVLRYVSNHLYVPKSDKPTKYSYRYTQEQIEKVLLNKIK